MDRQQIDMLLARADRALSQQQSFNAVMRDVYALAMPERDSWTAYGYGQDRSVQVFDSTAVVATSRFANRVQQALMPPQQRWAQLTLPPELQGMPQSRAAMQNAQAATDLVFRHIHASNLDDAVNQACYELAAGAMCLLVENARLASGRARGPLLRFTAVPSANVAFDEGPFGAVDGVFAQQHMPARLLERTYPDATLPDQLRKMAAEQPEAGVQLLQTTIEDWRNRAWMFRVLHKDTRSVLVERRYRTSPWIIARWAKAPGEIYGRGPLLQALPDIRALNKLVELHLQQASIDVAGIYTAINDGVLNADNVQLAPGEIVPVRSNGGAQGPSLSRLAGGGDYRLSEALRQQMQGNVRAILFDDPLPPEIVSGMTATEVQERIRRFQQDTGAFGRLHADLVVPLLHRVVDILDEAGAFAEPQFKGLREDLDDDLLRVVPTSPLARAQEQADVGAVMQVVQGLAALGDAGRALMTTAIDLRQAGPWLSRKLGVPEELIPAPEDLAAEEEKAAEAAQTEQLLGSPVVAQIAGAAMNRAAPPANDAGAAA